VSARNLTRTATAWHATLTVTMLAVCGLAWGEDQAATPPAADAKPADAQPAPAPAADATPAADGKPTPSGDQPSSASAEAAADFYYQRGMKAREQSRLDDAIHDLTIAVDWSPSNQTYRKALEQTQVLAGLHHPADG
jgi:hypothetical protein